MTSPLVSVVMPCFNPGPMLERSLPSCFAQDWPRLQIIVVDNNCTDGSAARARRLAAEAGVEIELTACAEQGGNHAANAGYRLVRGDYVQWLDSDDELLPRKIGAQVAALEAAPGTDIAYGDWYWCFHRPDAGVRCLEFPERNHADMLLELLANRWRPPNSYLLRRAAAERLREAGAWNPATPSNTDREYFTLAALLGLRFTHVADARVRYNNWSAAQVSRGTSAGARREALRGIFANLLTHAARCPAGALRASHWRRLRQDFALYRAVPGAGGSGLDGPDELLLSMLRHRPQPTRIEQLAALAARILWRGLEQQVQAPADARLARLRALLGLARPVTPADLRELTPLLQGDPPPAAPVLMPERIEIEERLLRLAEGGRLLRVEDAG